MGFSAFILQQQLDTFLAISSLLLFGRVGKKGIILLPCLAHVHRLYLHAFSFSSP